VSQEDQDLYDQNENWSHYLNESNLEIYIDPIIWKEVEEDE